MTAASSDDVTGEEDVDMAPLHDGAIEPQGRQQPHAIPSGSSSAATPAASSYPANPFDDSVPDVPTEDVLAEVERYEAAQGRVVTRTKGDDRRVWSHAYPRTWRLRWWLARTFKTRDYRYVREREEPAR